jgi:hypothetical protein
VVLPEAVDGDREGAAGARYAEPSVEPGSPRDGLGIPCDGIGEILALITLILEGVGLE